MARILLIDDDEVLRDTVSQMLAIDRHHITEAANGVEGLRRFGESPHDIVLTDVLMPQMDGAELITRLRELRPQQRIIAMSGGRRVLSPAFNLETAALAGATLQIAKPFTRQQLQGVIAQALAEAA